jgi:hypothetical protein
VLRERSGTSEPFFYLEGANLDDTARLFYASGSSATEVHVTARFVIVVRIAIN